ncbi:hypothetical protein UY3_17341 [Chelonia mydas]|uniref:Uncharacterized protein n=1 Tax=Chelonia mydas TaxID=8469 RepID=M7ART8_CHEMY|nr:hypothetical protein UY3_17341 [Chelonia mydas]
MPPNTQNALQKMFRVSSVEREDILLKYAAFFLPEVKYMKPVTDIAVQSIATAYYEIKPEDLLEARTSGHSTELRYYDDESHGMQEKEYDRDQQQCLLKAKELHQAYQKAREDNSQSSAEPQTYCFFKELHGGDPTTIPHTTVDTSEEPESQAPGVNSKSEEEDGKHATERSSIAVSQDLFETP